MRSWIGALVLVAVSGCTLGDSDQAGSTTGPAVVVHCDAATPLGDTTAKIICPNGTP